MPVRDDVPKTFTIVIDPGHGGGQPGAVSGKLLEKDLNLAIARRFGGMIEDNLPDVRVIYTRWGDTNPSLADRGEIANKAKADLFFSIHMNSHGTTAANGSSTYVLGMHKTQENLEEAMRENEVIKLEDGYRETYEGFDPSSAESYIIFQLMQYAHFDHSLALAKIVQKHYTAVTPMRDRGAAQGGFVVLWKPAMPSVLTEVGFISNDKDRAYISSARGQTEVAKCLYDAFCEYRALLAAEGVGRTVSGQSTSAATDNSGEAVVLTPVPVETSSKSTTAGSASKSTTMTTPSTAEKSRRERGEEFYVQLFASRTRVKPDRGVVERRIDGWYKYCTGPYATRAEAARALEAARRKHRDAFITK